MSFQARYRPTFAERYPVAMLVAVVDFMLVMGAAYLAHWWRFNQLEMPSLYQSVALISALLAVLSLWLFGLYGSWRGKSLPAQVFRHLVGWAVVVGLLLSIAFFLKVSEDFSRQWYAYFVLLASGSSLCLRVLMFIALRRLRSSGRNLKLVLLVDGGGSAAEYLRSGRAWDEDGFRIVHSLSFSKSATWIKTLVAEVDKHGVHELWLCLPLAEGSAIQSVLYALRHHTVAVRFMPEWGDLPLLNHKVSNIAGLYSIDLSCSPMDGPARLVKRLEDIVIGGVISVAIVPVCLLIALAIKCTSQGPVLFKQYRTGMNGRKFKVYKFRSMVVHREQHGEVTQATRNDPRVTRIGAFLRRTSLDELPQFFNVLQGRMSIVGPRPHALEHNEYYKDLVESYMQRHKVKPGITGWAQVKGYRGETDTLEKMQKRVECDLWYLDNWSLWLDIKIIFWTVFKGFIGKAAY